MGDTVPQGRRIQLTRVSGLWKLLPLHILVNVLALGYILTEFTANSLISDVGKKFIKKRFPLKQTGT